MNCRRAYINLLLALVLVTMPLLSQDHPVIERGATAGALSSIDNVNLQNGNVNLRIPIGPTVPVGGNLKFGLTLWYNSKVWDNQDGVYSLPHFGNIPDSYPSRKSNAGIGWTLSLGKLIPPRPHTTDPQNHTGHWMYIGSDGSNHLLYGQLHEGDPADPHDHYSRDGSYLRLLGGGPGNAHQLEFPDGTLHIFDNQNRLVKITDRFDQANTVQISYNVQSNGDHDWTIRDSHDRVWVLHWTKITVWGQHSIPEEDRTYDQLVAAEVPAPGGGRVVYDFIYQRRRVAMGCFAPDPENFPAEVEFLTSVRLPDPDGSGPQGRQAYTMSYYDDPVFNPTITGTNNPYANYDNCANSALQVLKLPTGGQLHYRYKDFQIRPHCENPLAPVHWFLQKTPWVIHREYTDSAGNNLGKWVYFYKESGPPEGNLTPLNRCDDPSLQDQASEVLTTRVIDSKGDRSYFFFSIWPLGETSEHGFNQHDYRLPYLKPGAPIAMDWLGFHIPDPGQAPFYADGENRFLSSVVYDCDADDPSGDSCRLYRAEYLRYETENAFDDVVAGGQADSMTQDRNARVVSSKTVHHFQDGSETRANSVTTDYSRFDGLGHFREKVVRGFPNPAPRITKTDYNSQIPDLILDADHRPISYTMWPMEAPWVLGTFSYREQSEGNQCARQEYLFDPQTGFLEKNLRLADLSCPPGRNENDVLTWYHHDGSGNGSGVALFGGDRQALPNLPLASLNPTGPVFYTAIDYAYGVETHRRELDGEGRTVLDHGLRTPDPSTGIITVEQGADGVMVRKSYDLLGRLTLVDQPEPYADTRISYVNATANQGPQKMVSSEQNGVLTKVHQQLDGFSRPLSEYEQMPDGQFARTNIRYGSIGWADRVSMPFTVTHVGETATVPGYLHYQQFDPDGRPSQVTLPDGHVQTLVVKAQHEFVTRQSIRTQIDGETDVRKTIFKDDRGRVVQVTETSGGGLVDTTYQYDLLDRLRAVNMMGDGITQQRLFTYDGRGFLLEECHPEKGDNGNGCVTYGGYDPRGNPSVMEDGPIRLRRRYDDAGRLCQVIDDHQNLLMEELFYAVGNLENGHNKTSGKLFQVKRHNYLDLASPETLNHTITETYYYRDPRGQLTEKRTRSSQGASFAQFFDYDSLGKIVQWTYPHQNHDAATGDPIRQVSMGYRHGALDWMQHQLDGGPGAYVIRRIAYHPTLQPYLLVHGNRVTDVRPLDVSGMARPAQIYTTGADQNWDSGPYRYDGNSNIWRIGNNYFAYDFRDRLLRAQMSFGAFDYQYDRFGNMTHMETVPLSVDRATNRLQGSAFAYDGAGNMLSGQGLDYTYDGFSMVISSTDDQGQKRYLYGPGNQRIATLDLGSGEAKWTLRDPNNQVIREYTRSGQGAWQASRDYFYRGGLIASHDIQQDTIRHYHLDHLSSPRLVTDGQGQQVSRHDYLPFGVEWTADDGNEQLKFTGQERDGENQDYFHARYYNPLDARFSSPDRILGELDNPQSWNRYAYALNNPLKFADPDGNDEVYQITIFSRGVMNEVVKHDEINYASTVAMGFRTLVEIANAWEVTEGSRKITREITKFFFRKGSGFGLGAKAEMGGAALRSNLGGPLGTRVSNSASILVLFELFVTSMEATYIYDQILGEERALADSEMAGLLLGITFFSVERPDKEDQNFLIYIEEKKSDGNGNPNLKLAWREYLQKKRAEAQERQRQQKTKK